MHTNEKRKEWLKAHVKSLQTLGQQEELISNMKNFVKEIEDNPKTTRVREEFEKLQQQVVNLLSPKDSDSDYIHQLSNMALLSSGHNSVVSNYAFDAKRNLILEMDKRGLYIPFCTKMVFLKYYSAEDTNLHFWDKNDRDAYVNAMLKVLSNYLTIDKQKIK